MHILNIKGVNDRAISELAATLDDRIRSNSKNNKQNGRQIHTNSKLPQRS